MNEENELKIQELTEELEKYLANNSCSDLARLIVKRIPREYYYRLSLVLHRKNNEQEGEKI